MAKRQPKGWVFKNERGRTLGFAEPGDCLDAEDAYRQLSREYGEHFEIFFRDADGVLHSTEDESKPDDFLTAAERDELEASD